MFPMFLILIFFNNKKESVFNYLWFFKIVQKFFLNFSTTGQLVQRQRVRLCNGRSKIQISGQSNQTQGCQRLATAATFFRKKLSFPGAIRRRRASQIRYTLRRSTTTSEHHEIFYLNFVNVA